jgi:pimeloyl-ACP methyl ester carboxylesterase
LLHGALGAASQFAPLSDALHGLAGDGLIVHTLDFEGHGEAPARERPFRVSHFAENVRELLDRHHIERARIFGYSMGGYVALSMAAAEPERVERVMTLGTKFRWTPKVAENEGRMLDPRRIEEKVPHFARALAARHASGWEHVLERTRDLMRTLGEQLDLADETLRAIKVPVRISVGDRDATVSVEESAEISRLLAAGELEVLPRTPHPLEKISVERLARSMVEFLIAEQAVD